MPLLRHRSRTLLVTMYCLALTATAARAADWGGITPGTSTKDAVRATYGEPTRSVSKTLDGYDVTDWVYEGEGAPGGIVRLTVEFGLLTGPGFQPDVVRAFRLDPVPGVFTRRTIIAGWGMPFAAGREGDTPEFYYDEGLLVLFDKDGWIAERLIFTLPQPRQNE